MPRPLSTALAVALWFCANVGLLLVNKVVLSSWPRPLSLSLLHFSLCGPLAAACCAALSIRPEAARQVLSGWRLRVLAALTAASVATGNAALRHLPASFVQAVSSVDPVFTALAAWALSGVLERPAVLVALVPVVAGTALAAAAEPAFHAAGLALCIAAAASRAFKSVLQEQLLLTGGGGSSSSSSASAGPPPPPVKLHSLLLLRSVAPLACALLLPAAALLERGAGAEALALCTGAIAPPRLPPAAAPPPPDTAAAAALGAAAPRWLWLLVPVRAGGGAAPEPPAGPAFAALLLLSCLAAFGMNVSNLVVTRLCGALTLQARETRPAHSASTPVCSTLFSCTPPCAQVLGKAKAALGYVCALVVFGNPVTLPGIAGYGLCLAGVAAYGRAKAGTRKDAARVHAEEDKP